MLTAQVLMGKRKKLEKVKDNYFGEREEAAVVAYNTAISTVEKHRIYNSVLKVPFERMAEIVYKRYHSKDNKGGLEIEEIIHEALTHLFQNLHKFNPNMLNKQGQKVKAYSYYQTVIRNFYKDYGKNSYKNMINHLSFEDHYEEIESRPDYSYEMDTNDESELKEKLINMIVQKIRVRIDNDTTLKKNEIIVGEAIIKVLANWHILFMEETEIGHYNKKISNNFAKNKILLFLKEQTNLSTKEIRSSMKQYKDLYFFEKNEFFKDEG